MKYQYSTSGSTSTPPVLLDRCCAAPDDDKRATRDTGLQGVWVFSCDLPRSAHAAPCVLNRAFTLLFQVTTRDRCTAQYHPVEAHASHAQWQRLSAELMKL